MSAAGRTAVVWGVRLVAGGREWWLAHEECDGEDVYSLVSRGHGMQLACETEEEARGYAGRVGLVGADVASYPLWS